MLDLWIPLVRMLFPSPPTSSLPRHRIPLGIRVIWLPSLQNKKLEEKWEMQRRRDKTGSKSWRHVWDAAGSKRQAVCGCAKQTFQTKRVENRMNYLEIGQTLWKCDETITVSAHVLTNSLLGQEGLRGVGSVWIYCRKGRLTLSISKHAEKNISKFSKFSFYLAKKMSRRDFLISRMSTVIREEVSVFPEGSWLSDLQPLSITWMSSSVWRFGAKHFLIR